MVEFDDWFSNFSMSHLKFWSYDMVATLKIKVMNYRCSFMNFKAIPYLLQKVAWILKKSLKFVRFREYFKLHNFVSNVTSMLISAYICKCALSQIKILKSEKKNKLSQESLKSSFLTVTTKNGSGYFQLNQLACSQCFYWNKCKKHKKVKFSYNKYYLTWKYYIISNDRNFVNKC